MSIPSTDDQQILVDLGTLRSSAGTDVGMRREENQDAFALVKREGFHAYFVADGMGGVRGGAVASRTAVSSLEDLLKNEIVAPTVDTLRSIIDSINQCIFKKGGSDPTLAGMGTTLIGLIFTPSGALCVNVGDSRAYRVRGDSITQLSEDHTLVRELVHSGAITADQAEHHPVAHMLTRSLGPVKEVQPEFTVLEHPQPGDLYLLCSDGLYNLVKPAEIVNVLRENSLDEVSQVLINLANQRGGVDNITVIVIAVGKGGERRAGEKRQGERGASETFRGEGYRSGGDAGARLRAELGLDDDDDDEEEDDDEEDFDEADDDQDADGQNANTGVGRDTVAYGDDTAVTEYRARPGSSRRSEEGVRTREDLRGAVVAGAQGASGHSGASSQRRSGTGGASAASVGTESDTRSRKRSRRQVEDGAERPPRVEEPPTTDRVAEQRKRTRFSYHRPTHTLPVPILVIAALVFGMVVGSLARRMLHPFDLFEVAKVGERGEGRSAGAEGAAAGRESADRDLRLTVSRLERAVSVNADPDILQEAIRERDKVTRDAFETSIQKLKSQIAALDKPNVVGSKDTVAVTKKRAEDVQASLAAIEEQIGVASRKLQLWYSRQKRLETLDALRLAAEVGASSEDVQKKKAAFEAATYDLIRTLDDVEQNQPNDDRQRDRLAQVKEKRNRLLRELQEEVRRTVDSVLAETNRHIEDLKIQRQLLSLQLETVKQDLEFARTLAEPDQDRRQAMKIKLEHNLEALQASLSDLERLVLGAGGGDPRLDERLRESARVKAQGTLESETQPE